MVIQVPRVHNYSSQLPALLLLLGLVPTWGLATTDLSEKETTLYEGNKFAIGAGFGIVKFDTNVKVTDKTSGATRFLDLEGNLNLPEISHVTTIYGAYRFNEKHSILFGYFSINRSVSVLTIDENFDDIILINADVSISDNTSFYNLVYGYSLFQDDRSNVTFVAGLNGLDLNLQVEASGQITVDGISRSNAVVAEAKVFVPLPLVGLNFGFSFTPKWSVGTKISLVGGSYEDVSAVVIQTSINSRYQFSARSGLLMGITYFDADVSIDDVADITDISYGYTGAFIGAHFGF
jgi:hypothetical protein